MLHVLLFGRLRNSELIEFLHLLLDILTDNDPAKLKIDAKTTALRAILTKLEGVFQLSKGSPFTKDLEALDLNRDQAIVAIRRIANGYEFHFDANKKAAAEKIIKLLKKHGKYIEDLNYVDEANVVRSIIDEYEASTDLQNAFALLHIDDLPPYLKAENKAFEDKYGTRIYSDSNKPKESVSELRSSVKTTYTDFEKTFNALATLDTASAYTKVLNALNALIDKFNDISKR